MENGRCVMVACSQHGNNSEADLNKESLSKRAQTESVKAREASNGICHQSKIMDVFIIARFYIKQFCFDLNLCIQTETGRFEIWLCGFYGTKIVPDKPN